MTASHPPPTDGSDWLPISTSWSKRFLLFPFYNDDLGPVLSRELVAREEGRNRPSSSPERTKRFGRECSIPALGVINGV